MSIPIFSRACGAVVALSAVVCLPAAEVVLASPAPLPSEMDNGRTGAVDTAPKTVKDELVVV